jgi:hypothetical protein
MKNIITSILIITSFSLSAQDSTEPSLYSETIKKLLQQIEFSDTIYNKSTSIETINFFNERHQIVKKVIRNIHSSLGISGPRTEIYDNNGNKLLEEIQDYKGVVWHRYTYQYNERNQLSSKSGFSAGELGHTIEYKYDEQGKLCEEVESRDGKIINTKRIE